MQSVLPTIGHRPDTRALIYDAKRDMVPLLAGLPLSADIVILNPFDARSIAWDIARDLDDPATTLEMAAILFPTRPGDSQPFFNKAAQALGAGVMRAFMISAPGNWTLRDVVLALSDPNTLKLVLSSTPETQKLIVRYFQPEQTFQNIIQQLANETATLETIAALWHHSAHKMSLREWLGGSSILVLGTDWTYTEALRALNRLIFKRLTQLVLNASESFIRRTWFFVDELKEAGNLDGLPSLMTNGRSKGVRVAVAFQDIEGLRHVYGDKPANEIIGMCANKAFLRLDSEATARWAAQTIGEELGSEFTASTSHSSHGTTEGRNEQIYKRVAVLPSELMRLPPADAERFSGYFNVPRIGVYRVTWAYRQGLSPQAELPDFIPRPVADQQLEPWSDGDLVRLGLSPKPSVGRSTQGSLFAATPRITRETAS